MEMNKQRFYARSLLVVIVLVVLAMATVSLGLGITGRRDLGGRPGVQPPPPLPHGSVGPRCVSNDPNKPCPPPAAFSP